MTREELMVLVEAADTLKTLRPKVFRRSGAAHDVDTYDRAANAALAMLFPSRYHKGGPCWCGESHSAKEGLRLNGLEARFLTPEEIDALPTEDDDPPEDPNALREWLAGERP